MPETHTQLLSSQQGWAFRDGRPNEGGSQSRSLPVPFPGTLAGAYRTLQGSNADGKFIGKPDELLQMSCHGPLLCVVRNHNKPEFFFPAPGDALWSEDATSQKKRLFALHPLKSETLLSNLPAEMIAVGLNSEEAKQAEGKPPKGTPAFWPWSAVEKWLLTSQAEPVPLLKNGLTFPVADCRWSVGMNAQNTAKDGALYRVERRSYHKLAQKESEEVCISVRTATNLANRQGVLGGERTVTRWDKCADWPLLPKQIAEEICQSGRCRIVLATPAIFTEGWKPKWLLEAQHGVSAKLKAVKVDRPQTLSGWDFKTGKPKPTRALAPAGSVYWLELDGSAEARRQWLHALWLNPISDTAQDRLDGYGLALIGTAKGDQ